MQSYQNILDNLEKSDFRRKFILKQKDKEYINQKGLNVIKEHAYHFIKDRLAPAYPINDGKQTPTKNHPVFIAQHATATCCRGCLEKWHKIEKGRKLTDYEIDFIVELVMAWIERQLDKTA